MPQLKLLANENIPRKAIRTLKQKGLDVRGVTEISKGLSDEDVLKFAKEEGRIVVTFDRDFAELAFRGKRQVKGIVLLRFVPKSPEQVAKRVFSPPTGRMKLERNLVIIEEDRVRVIPLNKPQG